MTKPNTDDRQVVALSIDAGASHEELARQVAKVVGGVTDSLATALRRSGVTNARGVVLDALADLYREGVAADGRLPEAAGFARDLLSLADALAWPFNADLTGAADWTQADGIKVYAAAPMRVSGTVRGFFAVHQGCGGSGWTLTHLPTGMKMAEAMDGAPLRRLAEQVEGLCDWNWAAPHSPAAAEAAKVVATHIAPFLRRHRDLTDFQPAGRA